MTVSPQIAPTPPCIKAWQSGGTLHHEQRWADLNGEIGNLTWWCQDDNLLLNIRKPKEMIVDFERMRWCWRRHLSEAGWGWKGDRNRLAGGDQGWFLEELFQHCGERRNPTGMFQKRLLQESWEFSRIRARNGRLEMGWRLLRLLGSVLGFFSIGVIAACFQRWGNSSSGERWMYACNRRGQRVDGGFKQGSWEVVELTGWLFGCFNQMSDLSEGRKN